MPSAFACFALVALSIWLGASGHAWWLLLTVPLALGFFACGGDEDD